MGLGLQSEGQGRATSVGRERRPMAKRTLSRQWHQLQGKKESRVLVMFILKG